MVLYELLTGVAPYAGQTDVDTLRQLILSEPAMPRALRPDVPRDLEAIVLRGLAKRPAGRYATSHELVADLRRFLAVEATQSRPLRGMTTPARTFRLNLNMARFNAWFDCWTKHLATVATHRRDWDTLPLPDALFPL